MKKLIYIAFLLGATAVNAQNSATFNIKYTPNRTYNSTLQINMDGKATLSGDDTTIQKLGKMGITQPLSLSLGMNMHGSTKTGSPDGNNRFTLISAYKIDSIGGKVNGKAMPIPAGQKGRDIKIYGHVGPDGKLKVDSSNNHKLKDTSLQKMSGMINSVQTLVKFPDQPMHIGDTFTQDIPLNMAMHGNNLAGNSKSVYKLVGIAKGRAYFDVAQSIDMSIPVKGSVVTLKGNGAGKLIYDINNNFPMDFTSKMDLKINGQIGTLQIDGSASVNMECTNVVNQ